MVETVAADVVVEADVERAWVAWTTPEAFARWFKPSRGATCRVLAMDVRVGGRWGIEVEPAGASTYRVGGTYLALDRPRHLRFTWTWEAGGPPGFDDETVVDVELGQEAGRTRVRVRHERIPPRLAQLHRDGWNGALAQLLARRSE